MQYVSKKLKDINELKDKLEDHIQFLDDQLKDWNGEDARFSFIRKHETETFEYIVDMNLDYDIGYNFLVFSDGILIHKCSCLRGDIDDDFSIIEWFTNDHNYIESRTLEIGWHEELEIKFFGDEHDYDIDELRKERYVEHLLTKNLPEIYGY
jgi:hypothetical protein